MADMTPEAAAALRAEFPASAIGKLPKAGMQLDYVGHAAVTDRLIAVDPCWTWEPFALAADGGPLIRIGGKDAELWIRLTVCGQTRIGIGTAPAAAQELGKQLVSDAIRNAAMRFGVALDLWSKEDLHDAKAATETAAEPRIPAARADEIRDLLNGSDGDTRKAWIARFRAKPHDLPLALLAEANDWLSDLEPTA